MRRGFTLVELSIVLVLIGLIIGGILVARSLFETAGVHKTVRQLSQMDVAITDFQTKYQKLPGDSPLFKFQPGSYTSGPDTGNGDGLVEDDSGTTGLGRTWTAEVANFWPMLNVTGLRSEANYSAGITNGKLSVAGDTPNMPAVSLGDKGTGIFFSNDNGYLNDYNISGVYVIGKVTENDGSDLSFPHAGMGAMTIGNALRSSALLAIDKKTDDGFASTGKIVAFSTSPGICYNADTPATYNVNNSDFSCSAAIKYPFDDGVAAGSGIQCGGGSYTPDPGNCVSGGGTWDGCNATCTGGSGGGGGIDCGCGVGAACSDPNTPPGCPSWDGCNCSCGTGYAYNTGSGSCEATGSCGTITCASGTTGSWPICGCLDTGGCGPGGYFNTSDGTCTCGPGYGFDSSARACVINTVCGNGSCESGENCSSCPSDCGTTEASMGGLCTSRGGQWDACNGMCSSCPAGNIDSVSCNNY